MGQAAHRRFPQARFTPRLTPGETSRGKSSCVTMETASLHPHDRRTTNKTPSVGVSKYLMTPESNDGIPTDGSYSGRAELANFSSLLAKPAHIVARILERVGVNRVPRENEERGALDPARSRETLRLASF